MKALTLVSAALCSAAATILPAKAEDLEFLLINESNAAITGFFVSPASSNDWQNNLMSGAPLGAGYETDIYIQDGLATCVYDIRADFSDGEQLEDYGLDLCELGSYTFE
ncbi:hypothetical protein [Roseibium sp.]|uniref:hypothetical protein n=1 Tax=Roseibium sp. TaxID=1936156 RepID=UPI003D0C37E0